MPEIVQEIGAYAGLASVVGLAVLSALYFSQARDVKRLREWAGRAPERAEGQAPAVPGRLAAPAAPKPGQASPGAPAPPAAAAAATGARPATAPAAEGRPGAATPAARPQPPVPAAAGAAGAAAKPGGAVPVPAAASAGTAAPPKPAGTGQNAGSQSASAPAAAPQKEAAPKSSAGNAGSAPPAPPGGPATPAGQRPPAAPPVPPRASTRPTPQPTAVIAPPRSEPWYRRLLANPMYVVLVVAGVLILGGAAAFGVTQLAGDGGDESASAGRSAGGDSADDAQSASDENGAQDGSDKQRKGGAIKPSSVTVAVLNGTTVPGLAATLMDQVTGAGFDGGTIADFTPNQQLAESVVQYASGHEREAAAVSRRLGIGQRQGASAESRELAGDAKVIVIAGADKAP